MQRWGRRWWSWGVEGHGEGGELVLEQDKVSHFFGRRSSVVSL